MGKYELTYKISEKDKQFNCNVSRNIVIPFVAENKTIAKEKAKSILIEDSRYEKGDYNTLHEIVRKEVR